MIIIKPVLTNDKNWEVAENASRAPFFVVFEDGIFKKTIKNPFVSWGGAGFAVADLLKDESCDKFLVKKIWGNLKTKLDEYNISYEIIS